MWQTSGRRPSSTSTCDICRCFLQMWTKSKKQLEAFSAMGKRKSSLDSFRRIGEVFHYGVFYTIFISEDESEWGICHGRRDEGGTRDELYLARDVKTELYRAINEDFAALVKPILRKALMAADPSVSPNARMG